jgi:SAM-dependent methyltransferase
MLRKEWIEEVKKEKDYKKYVGNRNKYYDIGLKQFKMLLKYDLYKDDRFLDIGCGSLRIGRHLINYLNPNKYYGIESEGWLIKEAIKYEIHEDIIKEKNPIFSINGDFNLQVFKKKYDYILANSIFIHASESQVDMVLSQIKSLLRKNGTFIFNYITGKDNKEKDWTYPGHVTYSNKKIESILDKYELKFNYIEWEYAKDHKWVMVYE